MPATPVTISVGIQLKARPGEEGARRRGAVQVLDVNRKLPFRDAYELTVKVVNLIGFQAGAAIHLRRDGALIPRRV